MTPQVNQTGLVLTEICLTLEYWIKGVYLRQSGAEAGEMPQQLPSLPITHLISCHTQMGQKEKIPLWENSTHSWNALHVPHLN